MPHLDIGGSKIGRLVWPIYCYNNLITSPSLKSGWHINCIIINISRSIGISAEKGHCYTSTTSIFSLSSCNSFSGSEMLSIPLIRHERSLTKAKKMAAARRGSYVILVFPFLMIKERTPFILITVYQALSMILHCSIRGCNNRP